MHVIFFFIDVGSSLLPMCFSFLYTLCPEVIGSPIKLNADISCIQSCIFFAQGLKKSESQAGGSLSLEMLLDDSQTNLDPDKLINT